MKRLVTGAVACGTRVLILGDTKPDYTLLVSHLGGQVIRIGRGLDRINPLDAGPLGAALSAMTGVEAEQLRAEVRSRRLTLLLALATLIREARSATPRRSSSAVPSTSSTPAPLRHRPRPRSRTFCE